MNFKIFFDMIRGAEVNPFLGQKSTQMMSVYPFFDVIFSSLLPFFLHVSWYLWWVGWIGVVGDLGVVCGWLSRMMVLLVVVAALDRGVGGDGGGNDTYVIWVCTCTSYTQQQQN